VKKVSLIFLLVFLCIIQARSQEVLRDFIIKVDTPPSVREFFGDDGCSTEDGVIVFYTTITSLEFTMPETPERLRHQSSFDEKKKRYVLCIKPTDTFIGGITNYSILINGSNWKPQPCAVKSVRPNEAQYFKIDPIENEESKKLQEELDKKAKENKQLGTELAKTQQGHQEALGTVAELTKEIKKIKTTEKPPPVGGKRDKKFHFGLMGGVSISYQESDAWYYENGKLPNFGYYGGVLFEFKLGKTVSLQPEILVVKKGGKGQAYRSEDYIDNGTGEYIPNVLVNSKVQLHYIEVPFNLIINIPFNNNALFFGAGPQASYGIQGTLELVPSKDGFNFDGLEESYDAFYKSDEKFLNQLDFGVNFLAGCQFNDFFLRGGYDMGLTNIAFNRGEDYAEFRNSFFYFSIGVKF